jgi:hypothetical protein
VSPISLLDTAPRRVAPPAPIIAGLGAVMTVAGIVAVVNRACGVDPDCGDPDLWRRTYSWSEIYAELMAQGFVSALAHHGDVAGSLWNHNLIAVFRRPFAHEASR